MCLPRHQAAAGSVRQTRAAVTVKGRESSMLNEKILNPDASGESVRGRLVMIFLAIQGAVFEFRPIAQTTLLSCGSSVASAVWLRWRVAVSWEEQKHLG